MFGPWLDLSSARPARRESIGLLRFLVKRLATLVVTLLVSSFVIYRLAVPGTRQPDRHPHRRAHADARGDRDPRAALPPRRAVPRALLAVAEGGPDGRLRRLDPAPPGGVRPHHRPGHGDPVARALRVADHPHRGHRPRPARRRCGRAPSTPAWSSRRPSRRPSRRSWRPIVLLLVFAVNLGWFPATGERRGVRRPDLPPDAARDRPRHDVDGAGRARHPLVGARRAGPRARADRGQPRHPVPARAAPPRAAQRGHPDHHDRRPDDRVADRHLGGGRARVRAERPRRLPGGGGAERRTSPSSRASRWCSSWRS